MVVSVHFNNYNSNSEQKLIEDLIIESIRIHGQDMYYLPRILANEDPIYGESDVKQFNSAHLVEFYIKNIEGFQGDGQFLSAFNVEIRDQINLSIAKRVFNSDVIEKETEVELIRPREGDLIYFPLAKRLFMINYVNPYEHFFQLGNLYTWDIRCEVFEYSSEQFNTGIAEIDQIQKKYSLNINDYSLTDEDGAYLKDEDGNYLVTEMWNIRTRDPLADNDTLQAEANNFIDFSQINPFAPNGI